MELNRSYNPGYFSLEDILATQERVPCFVEKELKDVGFLDPSSDSADLASGTKLELPFWMVEVRKSWQVIVIMLTLPGIEVKYRQELRLCGGSQDTEGRVQGDHECRPPGG